MQIDRPAVFSGLAVPYSKCYSSACWICWQPELDAPRFRQPPKSRTPARDRPFEPVTAVAQDTSASLSD